MTTLSQAASWVALGFVGFLGATILALIWTGRINLNRLISEPNGDASLSRLQFLIFTFVIAVSFFLVVASPAQPAFPTEIPQGVFVLLGISGSSYLVSKSIQFSQSEGVAERPIEVSITTDDQTVTAGGAPVQFAAVVKRAATQNVRWTIDAPALGKIDANGLYTPPPKGSGADTVRATSVADADAFDTAQVTIQDVGAAAAGGGRG